MTEGEQFLDRVRTRLDDGLVRGWEIIIPMIFDFIMKMLEQCKTEAVVDACKDVSVANRLRARRECMSTAIAYRHDNGWGLFEAARNGRDIADQLIAEAEETVKADAVKAAGIVDEFLAVA